MTSRPIQPTAEGDFVFRPGRHYRLLLVVIGPTTCDELEEDLTAAGFQDAATSTPGEWQDDRPPDWPEEPCIGHCVNESVIRAKGAYFGDPRQRFSRDRSIDGSDALYTVCAAWECGPARRRPLEVTTGRAEASGDAAKGSQTVLVVLGIGAVAGAIWLGRQTQKERKEEEAIRRIEMKRERAEFDERIARYLARGKSPADAERLAEQSMMADEARALAQALEAEEA